jgi:hypothetical protein
VTVGRLNPVYIVLFGGLLLRLGTLLAVLSLGLYNVLAGTDSLSFYEDATYIAVSGDYYPFELGWKPYVNTLGFFMYQFGQSVSFMFLSSTAAWFLSAILIDKSLQIVGANQTMRLISAAVMAFEPSLLLATSIPMREAFQLLGMTIIAYSLVNIFVVRNYTYAILMIAGAALAGALHLSLLVSASLFSILIFLGLRYAEHKLSLFQIAVAGLLGIVVVIIVTGVIQARYDNGAADLLETVDVFRDTGASLDARAQYDDRVGPSSSVAGGIVGLFIGFVQYMLEPMPWRISSPGDIIVLIENILRLLLVGLVIRNFRALSHRERALSATLLLMFFTTEFVWSTGTINWGTAARHHVPSLSLLLIAAFALGRHQSKSGAVRYARAQLV